MIWIPQHLRLTVKTISTIVTQLRGESAALKLRLLWGTSSQKQVTRLGPSFVVRTYYRRLHLRPNTWQLSYENYWFWIAISRTLGWYRHSLANGLLLPTSPLTVLWLHQLSHPWTLLDALATASKQNHSLVRQNNCHREWTGGLSDVYVARLT